MRTIPELHFQSDFDILLMEPSEDVVLKQVTYKDQVLYEQQFFQNKEDQAPWYMNFTARSLQAYFPLHIHSFTEVYCLVEGAVDYLVDNEIFHLRPGDVIVIPTGTIHQSILRDKDSVYKRINLWIKPELLRALSTDTIALEQFLSPDAVSPHYLIPRDAHENHVIRTALEQLILLQNKNHYAQDELVHSFIRQIAIYAHDFFLNDHSRTSEEQALKNPLISSAINMISDHLSETLTLESLSKSLFVSKYHLAHAFKESMGVSVYQFILNRRLARARELIDAGCSLKEVCPECGFNNYSTFYKVFKSHIGMSPEEYRRKS